MTSFVKVAFALLFASMMVMYSEAQTSKMQATVASTPPGASCPVAMSAQHGVDGSMIAVSGEQRHDIGQEIKLTLNNSGRTAISSIRITVRGWSLEGRTLPARTVNSNYANASQTLELRASIAPHKSTKTNIWVSGLTSVQSIDLIEVHYAKGLSWRAPEAHVCRIAPDAEMFISHR